MAWTILGSTPGSCPRGATAVAPRGQLPGVDPRIVRAVGSRGDEHFVILDIDALLAPMLGS